MRRSITLVDAGYLLAAGASLCAGTVRRSDVDVDYAGLLRTLQSLTAERTPTGTTHLRTYWYDASPDQLPRSHHRDLDTHPRLRLRLGRLDQGRQKGVDALIAKDMARLAADPRVGALVLVSGDEDLLGAVEDAEDAAVEVILVTVTASPLSQPAQALINVADVHVVLTEQHLGSFIRLAPTSPPAAPPPAVNPPPTPVPGPVPSPHLFPPPAAAPAPTPPPIPVEVERSPAPEWVDRGPHGIGYAAGVRFVQANDEIPDDLIKGLPRLPTNVDIPLITNASALKNAYLSDAERRDLRAGFARGVIEQLHRSEVDA